MRTPPPSSEDKLQELDRALDGLERQKVPPASVLLKSNPPVEIGPKTKLAMRIMAWGLGLFWVFWLALALVVSPPRQIADLLVVPFSAFVCWLLFQGYRLILVSVVRKMPGNR